MSSSSRSGAVLNHFSDDKVSLVLPTVIVLLLAGLIARTLFGAADPLSHIPLVGQELGSNEKRRQAFLANAKGIYQDGYRKFKDGLFRIVSTKANTVVVVVAPRYLDELKSLPDDVLSMEDAVAQSLHVKYTKLLVGDNTVAHTIKSSLTPALPHLNPSLSDEVQRCFRAELPPCDDWTPINVYRTLLRIVARVSGRVFVGPELCCNEGYLDAAINYTVEIMYARRAIDAMAPWKRPLVAWRLPEVKRLEERFNQATAFLRPVVEARMKMGPDEEKPDDVLQWLMDDGQAKFGDRASARMLALEQLGLSFAAIHTTTMTGTNALYDLAASPDLIAELRREIVPILSAHNGIMSTHALQAMKKLDSFLKESLRFHPPSASSFQRKVRKSFKLSTGETIPAGVVIEVATHAITRDPDAFDDAEKFRPLRFYEMRHRSSGETETAPKHQFVSVSAKSLSFGYGRHACPGRFFAANELKMILATLIVRYDVRLAEGQTERYRNLDFGASSIPDPSKELLFRRVAE